MDPIIEQFPWVTPYNYAENKPINGVDLWGLQWVSMHKWNDQVEGRRNGYTYRDLWGDQSFSTQLKYRQAGATFDCADFCIQQLVDFAYQNKLPIYFEDYKAEGVDPTFSNDAFAYTDGAGNKVSFKEGDWQSLASAIQTYYGASDIFNNSKLTSPFAEVKKDKDGNISYKNPENFKKIDLGSLIGTKWSGGSYHSQTINWLYTSDGTLKSIGLFNCTTGWQGADNPVVEYRYYSFDELLQLAERFEDGITIRFMEWNFSRFDKKSGK